MHFSIGTIVGVSMFCCRYFQYMLSLSTMPFDLFGCFFLLSLVSVSFCCCSQFGKTKISVNSVAMRMHVIDGEWLTNNKIIKLIINSSNVWYISQFIGFQFRSQYLLSEIKVLVYLLLRQCDVCSKSISIAMEILVWRCDFFNKTIKLINLAGDWFAFEWMSSLLFWFHGK